MMDHNKTRAEVERRKAELLERQQQIPQEIRKLHEESEFNKRQLIGIEQIIDGLSFMDSDAPYVPESFGLTDSVRKILGETAVTLVPTQIRDTLEQRGIMGSTSKNLLINVHKVIERIEDELDKTLTAEGKTAYRRREAWSPLLPMLGFHPLSGEYLPSIARPVFTARDALNPAAPKPSTETPSLRKAFRSPMRRRLYGRGLQRPASESDEKSEEK